MNKILLTVLLAPLVLFSCTGKKEKNAAVEKATLLASKNSVEVISLVKGNFPNQLVSNGKLNALRKSELKFRLSGEIAQVLVKSGEHVAKGQAIATLNDVDYRQRLAQIQISLKKSSLDLQDVLIGLGYDTLLTVHTTLKAIKGARIWFTHKLYNEQNVLVNETELAFMKKENWKPCPAPDMVLNAIKNV